MTQQGKKMNRSTRLMSMIVVGGGATLVLGLIGFILLSETHSPVMTGGTAVVSALVYQLHGLLGDA